MPSQLNPSIPISQLETGDAGVTCLDAIASELRLAFRYYALLRLRGAETPEEEIALDAALSSVRVLEAALAAVGGSE